MKLTIKLYRTHNFYAIYNGNDNIRSGQINGRDVRQIVKDNNFEIANLDLKTSYSYGITIYEVEVK